MTEEELEKEAEEYALNQWEGNLPWSVIQKAYYDGAEPREKRIDELEKENAELRAIAENQQSSNMSRYFENKKLKEGLAVGSTFNKALNSMNKTLEKERDKYRNMVFDKDEQLTKAKEIIKKFSEFVNNEVEYDPEHPQEHTDLWNELCEEAEQFIKDSEVKK